MSRVGWAQLTKHFSILCCRECGVPGVETRRVLSCLFLSNVDGIQICLAVVGLFLRPPGRVECYLRGFCGIARGKDHVNVGSFHKFTSPLHPSELPSAFRNSSSCCNLSVFRRWASASRFSSWRLKSHVLHICKQRRGEPQENYGPICVFQMPPSLAGTGIQNM